MGQPLMRCRSRLAAELSRESARRHGGTLRQTLDAHLMVQIRFQPAKHRRQPQLRALAHGLVDELSLASFAVGRDNESTRHLVRNLRSEVLPNDVQTKVDARRTPCRSQDLFFVDIEHVWLHTYLRIFRSQNVNVTPVRGGS